MVEPVLRNQNIMKDMFLMELHVESKHEVGLRFGHVHIGNFLYLATKI